MRDVYQTVTDFIVAAIEAGADKWVMPWHVKAGDGDAMPFNVASRKHYRGVNTLVLWSSAQAHGYPSHCWGTYKQWAEKGAQVRRGEKATSIVFWKFFDHTAPDGEGDGEETVTKTSAMARAYAVFNAAQVDGYVAPAAEVLPEVERIAHADAFFAATGADIRHGGSRAFYSPSQDFVQMPVAAAFRDMPAYYSTLAHEATHWTSHATRCDRSLGKRFGDEAYAAEELIAELGAAFTCAELNLSSEPRPDHAQYVANWLKVFKNDKRAVFTAASAAQKAMDFLLAKQPKDNAAEPADQMEYAMAA